MVKKAIALLLVIAIIFSVIQTVVFATENAVHPQVEAIKEFTDAKTHTLNEDVFANGCDGAIYVDNGTELTINGGNIHGVRCDGKKCGDSKCGFSMALWAFGKDTKVTINDGYFTNDSDGTDHCDLIYVKNGAYIYIKGGTFKCATPEWTLNAKDNSPGQIVVSGGKFFEFNPADNIVSAQGNQDVVIAEGYTVIKTFDEELNGFWYEVQPKSNIKEFTSEDGEVILNEDVKANGCDGAIYAHDGAKVTINGGSIHGCVCAEHDYSMALWAYGKNTEVTINDGYFTNDSDGSDHCDLIYVKNGAYIYIKGGTFKCATPEWTLNAKDNSPGQIVVSGGRFFKFNPEDNIVSAQGNQDVVVAKGYKVVKDGDWFEVVCAHLDCKEYSKKDATYTETGMEAYWECKLCSKIFADKDATVEVEDKNTLVISKLIEVTNGNAVIGDAAVEDAIKDAETAGDKTVVISTLETNETVTTVTLQVESLKDIANDEKELAIETSEVKIIINSKAVEEIAEQAGNSRDIKIEVSKVEKTVLNEAQKESIKDKEVAAIISAQILAGDKIISDFGGGKIKVEIPFVPAENEKGDDYIVVYIDDEGKIVEIPAKYVDGTFVVELEHFSEYAIVKKEKEEVKDTTTEGVGDTTNSGVEDTSKEEEKDVVTEDKKDVVTEDVKDTTKDSSSNGIVKTGDNIVIYISILVISIIGAVVIFLKKSNLKK